jgi:hypothetical protein
MFSMEENMQNDEIEWEIVEEETGYTPEQQMEALRTVHDGGIRVIDLVSQLADSSKHRFAAKMADKQSQRNFKLANRQLDMLEKVLTHHFAERKVQINGGFRMIDKALEEGNWDAAAKVFGDMSAMVAQSPLAAALALGEKMKSGKAITFDDF